MLMLTLAKKMQRVMNRISVEQLARVGYSYKPFDRRHTPNSNWARITGLRMLNESTIGIIGMGEIGREIAIRAAAFGMRILYFQRTRHVGAGRERELQATYVPLSRLLAESDWVVPQLPEGPATKNFIDRARLAQMKAGACLINVSRADVVDRTALIEALKSGRLGGFALDPLYEEPGRSDDELLKFDNVVMSPHIAAQPRFNALNDLADMMENLSNVLTERSAHEQGVPLPRHRRPRRAALRGGRGRRARPRPGADAQPRRRGRTTATCCSAAASTRSNPFPRRSGSKAPAWSRRSARTSPASASASASPMRPRRKAPMRNSASSRPRVSFRCPTRSTTARPPR